MKLSFLSLQRAIMWEVSCQLNIEFSCVIESRESRARGETKPFVCFSSSRITSPSHISFLSQKKWDEIFSESPFH